MKFVDETTLTVRAGRGGNGSASFRRERCVPFGGPDGGDGGNGGSVYLVAIEGLNTLADYRYTRSLEAENGEAGRGQQCSGKQGEDCVSRVPVGTIVRDAETGARLGDLTKVGQRLLVAQGGKGGIGNVHFKSSTNRSPHKFTRGTEGEIRTLHLELKLLADVGLLGLPNAGKSSLLARVSAAKPKIADYPFTTLHPGLGVMRIGLEECVIADIPGIIEGAAEGAGLGLTFLRHVSRTRLLLHLVDLHPFDAEPTPDEAVRLMEHELATFSAELAAKPRWLVFNKMDLLPEKDQATQIEQWVKALQWEGPVFSISAVTGVGVEALSKAVIQFLAENPVPNEPVEESVTAVIMASGEFDIRVPPDVG